MSLASGTRLGSYEVVGELGRGGMGEVYRARDTRLGRDVAIKVLPPSVASSADRIARFEREAKTLAALNHPNVAAIHGLEESGGTKAIVLELVEGPTLADRIGGRPIPIAEALPIARQVADALEAAHDKGIIHRDLKPANIKVRADGTVKVLDFGLAKAYEAVRNADGSQSPTLTSPAQTMAGVVMGTAAYMSPEQAEGADVDQRSDIWSFGVVLYEMLTGARLFAGDSVQRVLAKVLEREVDLGALPAATPPAIRRLLRRCLERDRKRRLHHIADARVEIEEAITGAGQEAVQAPRVSTSQAYPLVWVLGSLVVILAAASAIVIWRVKPAQPASVTRFEITTARDAVPRLTGNYAEVAVSPDGKLLVYSSGDTAGTARLYMRQVDQVDATPLRGSERGVSPFFSPDGQRVGFIDAVANSLKQVSVFGGPPTTIAMVGRQIGGASWGPSDTIVFGGGAGSGLWQVSANGGEPKMLTALKEGDVVIGHNWPDVLPNGKGVLFTLTGNSAATSRIAVLSLETGTIKDLISGGGYPRFVSTGHIVYGVGGTLRAVAFDQNSFTVTGNSVPVVEGAVTKPFGAAMFALSGTGSLLYLRGDVTAGARRELMWVGRDGSEKHVAFADGSPFWPRLSPDGARAAFTSANDVWVVDLTRGSLSKVSDTGNTTFVLWHPDGRRVVYSALDQGTRHLYLKSADGTGVAEQLPFSGPRTMSPEGWAADGRLVVSYQSAGTTAFDIGILSKGFDALQPFLATQANEDSFTLSRDGRWIAYESDSTGQYEVYVERFPEGGERRAISAPDGGEDPLWSFDGTELFYRRLKDKAMMTVPVKTGPVFTAGATKALFQGNYIDAGGRNYDADRDGRRFLVFKNVAQGEASLPRLILVQNWTEELKRLAPTR